MACIRISSDCVDPTFSHVVCPFNSQQTCKLYCLLAVVNSALGALMVRYLLEGQPSVFVAVVVCQKKSPDYIYCVNAFAEVSYRSQNDCPVSCSHQHFLAFQLWHITSSIHTCWILFCVCFSAVIALRGGDSHHNGWE